tara:strand:+ start:2321 stop:3184 length:864 start_codon:yes stop_codon:yes gene_type:complete
VEVKRLFRLIEPLSDLEARQLSLLRELVRSFKKVCIAYSGGVDSALVAAIAQEQLGACAVAVTGVSPSLAPHLLTEARQQASWMGIEHRERQTNELNDPLYTSNPKDRCYSCKKELHIQLKEMLVRNLDVQVIDGVNFDDISDYRPGVRASWELGVRSPLVEIKIDKNSVRKISKSLGLPWWDKPSQPCLASRFPYGQPISAERLKQVCKAEEWIRNKGFQEVRVRSQGLSARIELPQDQINNFILKIEKSMIIDYFLSIGFTSVSVDIEGLVSGKLNRIGVNSIAN